MTVGCVLYLVQNGDVTMTQDWKKEAKKWEDKVKKNEERLKKLESEKKEQEQYKGKLGVVLSGMQADFQIQTPD